MPDWLIEQLGIPWYTYGWPMVVFGLALLYLLLWLLRLCARFISWMPQSRWQRWVIALPIAFVAVSWGVWSISREANRLCRAEGGLHVYKTVSAEGFFGASSIKYWSQYGFKYVESAGSGRYSIWTLVDGEKNHEYRDELTSRYAVNSKTYVPVGNDFFRSRYWMKDVQTGETLGELVTFTGPRGWTDNWLPGLMEGSPWICGKWVPEELQEKYGKTYGRQDLIKSTLLPER